MGYDQDTRPRSLDRRQFCRLLVGGALVAGAAPWLEGCGRLLDASSKQGATEATMAAAAPTSTTASPSTTETTTAPATNTTAPPPPDIAVVKGDDPEQNVRRVIAELGGMERFVRKGAKVLLKPNLLNAHPPEYAASTNPIVVATMVKLCLEAGAAQVTVTDRSTVADRIAFEVSGIAKAVEEAGGHVKYLDSRNYQEVKIPKGKALRSWPMVKDVFEADVFINLPIAKTHDITKVTMGMKNLMGILGGRRSTIHVDIEQKLVDISSLVKPHLVVLDAYRVLFRNGPTGGSLDDVKSPKTVVAGTDPVAVDAYGTRFFELKPTDLGYLVKAHEQGLGEIDLSRLTVREVTA